MRLASLFSGGKDSTYALYLAMKQGHEIKYLVTIFPKSKESWMFHYPCIELTKLQAKALGIKQITKITKGEKEKELEDLKKALERIRPRIEGIVSGAVESFYQKSRIDRICEELGLKSISPLWHREPEKLLKEEIASSFEVIITGVFAEGFDESWLGKRLDRKCIEELKELHRKYGIYVSGEGGCYETLTLDCSLFKKKLQVIKSRKIWEDMSGYLQIDKARLVSKNIGLPSASKANFR